MWKFRDKHKPHNNKISSNGFGKLIDGSNCC